MKEQKVRLKTQIKEKSALVKELKSEGKTQRAFQLYKEVTVLKSELNTIVQFDKIK